jgi:hypothetical protein
MNVQEEPCSRERKRLADRRAPGRKKSLGERTVWTREALSREALL